MLEQVNKYLDKLLKQGLVSDRQHVALYGLDDELYTNQGKVSQWVYDVFGKLNINSLLVARPEPVLWAIINELTRYDEEMIEPRDCESLTFIHDIPVIARMDALDIAKALNRRKGCIIKGVGIVTSGTVSLEQAFISFSSICFATFVKYFSDFINATSGIDSKSKFETARIEKVMELLSLSEPDLFENNLSADIPRDEDTILEAMNMAGKAIVEAALVDSFFGNISCRHEASIYISQTGSSLDELPGYIDAVPLDGSSSCELTSSSELGAHIKIYAITGDRVILHGHPKFSVIMSMYGPPLGFHEKRYVEDIPVVTGEVGSGKHGLVHTLPPAMKDGGSAIVHGHGTFCSDARSFHEAFDRLMGIEHMCYKACRDLVEKHS